jgi:hypothetical protein
LKQRKPAVQVRQIEIIRTGLLGRRKLGGIGIGTGDGGGGAVRAVIRHSGSKGFHMDCPKAEGVRKTESRNRRRAGPAHRKRADE